MHLFWSLRIALREGLHPSNNTELLGTPGLRQSGRSSFFRLPRVPTSPWATLSRAAEDAALERGLAVGQPRLQSFVFSVYLIARDLAMWSDFASRLRQLPMTDLLRKSFKAFEVFRHRLQALRI